MAQEVTLPSGRVVTFAMPDMLQLVAGGIDMPNAALADVITLIFDVYEPDPAKQLAAMGQRIRGLYEVAALCLAEPTVYIQRGKRARPLREGEISHRDLAWEDVMLLNAMFRYGSGPAVPPAGDPQPAMGAPAAPDGDGLPHAAE